MKAVFAPCLLLFVALAASPSALAGGSAPPLERQPLRGYYEPSGIAQLPDGRIVLVEDEREASISILTLLDDFTLSGTPLRVGSLLSLMLGGSVGPLDDLEAVTVGGEEFVFAITSHSRTPSGERRPDREKLVRFMVGDTRATELSLVTNLRDKIAELSDELAEAADVFDAKDDNGLIVEGLAYDGENDLLLIGLRGPVVDDMAVILSLEPDVAFSGDGKPFSADPFYLDLDGGGIRAMAFATRLNGFLIVSRQEKRGKNFKLWLWNPEGEQQPRRIRLPDNIDLEKAEGITPVSHNGIELIMITFDSGNRLRNRNAEYVLVPYDALQIEGSPEQESGQNAEAPPRAHAASGPVQVMDDLVELGQMSAQKLSRGANTVGGELQNLFRGL